MMIHILAFGFLTPWLMGAGALATSIPVIIHLLNKRKFRVVVWAAMEWLLAAQRRNARRLRFHRWLLLAVRCLALLFIAAGIAELMLQSTALGALAEDKHATIILWDDSYSMGYQQNAADAGGGVTAFEKSRKLIQDYIRSLPQGQAVMVIRASTGAALGSDIAKPIRDHQLVLDQQVDRAALSDSATDLPGAFERATQVLSDLGPATTQRELLLITDFTQSSIHVPRDGESGAADGAAGERLKNSATAAIRAATEFHLVNVGAAQQENLAVTDLRALRPITVAGDAIGLQVKVFNASDKPRSDVPVSLLVDGSPAATVKIPRIEPANFQTVEVSVPVATPGRHLVEAQLPDDLLPVDNVRRLMLNVRKDISVLLVDGNPGDGHARFDSTYYLQGAFPLSNMKKDAANVFTSTWIPESQLTATPLGNFDVVVLSDTSDLGAAREAVKNYVAAGGLLMVFPGIHTNAQLLNDALGAVGDPAGDRWVYTSQPPADSWMAPDFKDDSWNHGDGPFVADKPGTPWVTNDLWIRRSFDRPQDSRNVFTLEVRGIAHAEVYINDKPQAGIDAGTLHEGRRIPLNLEGVSGRAVIAVHVQAPAQRSAADPPFVDITSVNLLPAHLGSLALPSATGTTPPTIRKFDPEGFLKPVLQIFADAYRKGEEVGLLTVQTEQYLKLEVPTDGSAETILRYAGKQGAAASEEDAAVVLERGVGADEYGGLPGGNVVLFASTADTTWNSWGAKPSFLPFMQELVYYGLGRGTLNAGGGLTLTAGDALHLPASAAPAGAWKSPRNGQIQVSTDTRGGQPTLESPPLRFAGTYAPQAGTGDGRPVVAVNCDAREADVRTVPKETMAAALGTDVKNVIDNPTALKWGDTGAASGGSYGPLMMILALCFFLLESILALAFSTYR